MVKPDVVTLLTVPMAPPAAGPDRALDALPPAVVEGVGGVVEGDGAVVEGDAAVDEGDDVAQPAKSAIAPIDAAATIHRRLGFDSNRRAFGRRACWAMDTGPDGSGEGAGGPGVAPVSGELVGSQSFMVAFSSQVAVQRVSAPFT
jgi:hypothetical protein